MRITVTRMADDLLSGRTWEFWFYDHSNALVLDKYIELSRATKRHKYKIDEHYSRLDERGSSLREHEVLIPDDVSAEAIEKFFEKIVVVKWSELK